MTQATQCAVCTHGLLDPGHVHVEIMLTTTGPKGAVSNRVALALCARCASQHPGLSRDRVRAAAGNMYLKAAGSLLGPDAMQSGG